MSAAQKTLTGIAAFLPIITLVVYFIVFFSFFMDMLPYMHNHYEPEPEEFLPGIFLIVLTAIIMGLVMLGIKVFFIIHSLNNRQVQGDERIVWILVFIFAGIVAYPIYWYMRIVQQPNTPAAA